MYGICGNQKIKVTVRLGSAPGTPCEQLCEPLLDKDGASSIHHFRYHVSSFYSLALLESPTVLYFVSLHASPPPAE
jgi:hypothetical protein